MRHVVFAIILGTSLSSSPVAANNEPTKVIAAPDADPNQKIKCRVVEVTGSLVKRGKVCKTVAEWRAIMENGSYLARKMVEDGTTRAGGQ